MSFNNNFDDFKKWLKEEKEDDNQQKQFKLLGFQVSPRFCENKTIKNVISHTGKSLDGIMEDFKNDGGIIIETQKNNIMIETACGETFLIPKYFVKKSSSVS